MWRDMVPIWKNLPGTFLKLLRSDHSFPDLSKYLRFVKKNGNDEKGVGMRNAIHDE